MTSRSGWRERTTSTSASSRAVALALAVLCCTAAGAAAPSRASAQDLEVDNSPVGFGDVAVTGRKVDATATITNRVGVPLTLSSVNHNTDFGPAFGDPDESCFTLDALQPGETCTAAIAFTPQALGARSATLRYNYARGDGTSTVATIDATGTGIEAAPISVQPGERAFGSARVGTAAPNQSITVTNPGTTPLEVATASLGGAQAGDFAIASTTAATARRCRRARPAPSWSVSRHPRRALARRRSPSRPTPRAAPSTSR